MKILGLSAFYHDSAAAILVDGKIIAAAEEERFTRRKHDREFPTNALRFCLEKSGLSVAELDAIAFYDKPLLKFERILETHLDYAPYGFTSFARSMPVWLKEKLFFRSLVRKNFKPWLDKKQKMPPLLFAEHHESHAASAFFPSPFESAAVLCMDGVGEWATTSLWHGNGSRLQPISEIHFPHSLGLLYSAFTYYAGFKVNSGEYKLMGLAPYGTPKYQNIIREHLIDIKDDGSFRLNMDYFAFATEMTMTNAKFDRLFGGPARRAESEISQKEKDLAASVQIVLEDVVLKLAKTAQRETGEKNLCLAGGVALNCVANGRLVREGPFENLWVQPASGDSGGAIGAALAANYEHFKQERRTQVQDGMSGALLGPQFDDAHVASALHGFGAVHAKLERKEFLQMVAQALASGKVVGWFQGPMEFGPRALGGRSILADPRVPEMREILNEKIKLREGFRPFAPAVCAESVNKYFELNEPSPYMLIVAPVKSGLNLPAITHVDRSARIQTVHSETNPLFHELIKEFGSQTGIEVLVNTSFNVRGEPIVCTPEDAYRCFMHTDMDALAVGSYWLEKHNQPAGDWKREVLLD